MNDYFLVLIVSLQFLLVILKENECDSDAGCESRWPQSFCRRGKCACKMNYIRRKSESRGWLCLSLQDAETSMLGPPITCPLPDGAGFHVIFKDANGKTVFCQTNTNQSLKLPPCPDGYECIQAIGVLSNEWDGVCCPKQEKSCDSKQIEIDQSGWLQRWYFDGEKCQEFMWNPKLTKSPNTFTSESHCISYCIKSK